MREKIKILVVEDEYLPRKKYVRLLKEWGYNVVGAVDNYIEAIKSIQYDKPHVVLLDIQLANYKDGGLKVAKYIVENCVETLIAFLTKEENVELHELLDSGCKLQFFAKPISEKTMKMNLSIFTHNLNRAVGDNDYWMIDDQISKKKIKVFFHLILYIEGANNDIIIHLAEKHTITGKFKLRYRFTLKKFLDKFVVIHSQFKQTHRSYIVNTNYIYGIDDKRELLLLNEEQKVKYSKTFFQV